MPGMNATSEWRPQAFGRRRARDVREPLIEPLWEGERVLAWVGPGRPVRVVDASGVDLGETHPEVADALAEFVAAESAILDGYLTDQATRTSVGAAIVGGEPMTAGGMIGQMVLGKAPAQAETPRLAHDRGHQVAFVAVDLLELDGQALLDLPLLERKRLLESVVFEGDLVRWSPYVRPPVDPWLVTWRSLGFRSLAFKGANSRYRPGSTSQEWAVVEIPRR